MWSKVNEIGRGKVGRLINFSSDKFVEIGCLVKCFIKQNKTNHTTY